MTPPALPFPARVFSTLTTATLGMVREDPRDSAYKVSERNPFYDFATNQIWAVIATLAHSLTTWAGLILGINPETVEAYAATGTQRL
ncbi:hypothetical protein [Corynebacterium cystitidis]|uniref:hypothetical protein n=1 Tax=Corynebacterium cystitidis TaxID=35757 RepID=UPI00211F2642|nr:hypothetical protein [Corynebacterium cystitidis]